MKRRFLSAVAFFAALSAFFCGCTGGGREEQEEQNGGSYFVQLDIEPGDLSVDGVSVAGEEYASLMQELETLLNGLEDKISLDFAESDVSRINAAKAGEQVAVSEEMRALLEASASFSRISGGKFSPAVFPLTELWGFAPSDEGEYTVSRPEPSADEIARAAALSDLSPSTFGGNVEKSERGAKLELGSVAKGYMCDRVVSYILDKYAGSRVDGIVRVSTSNSAYLGTVRENGIERGYNVAVENPRRLSTGIAYGLYLVGLSDVSVTTSADNYRCYVYDAKIYPHIIDPETGSPADRGIISVTVVVPNAAHEYPGAFADSLSTAGFCMSLTEAIAFFESLSEEYGIGALIVTKDFKYYSVGDLTVMNRSEYARYCNEYLGGDYDLDKIADVFAEGDIDSATEEIVPDARELEYIEKLESVLN